MRSPEHLRLRPLIVKGYNDQRRTVQIQIPNEKDVGEDSAHMFIFTRYVRLFYEALETAIKTFEEESADGISVKESAGRLLDNWTEATNVLMRLAEFGIEFSDYLSAGPGVPSMPKCALCRSRLIHSKGADLCATCLISVLETPKEGR